jgi:phospholipase C
MFPKIAMFAALSVAIQWICPAAMAQSPLKFQHVVIVFQENRTPDNLFGSNPTFEPGVDIATSGVNSQGQTIPLAPLPLADCYDVGHTHPDFELSLQGADLDPVSPIWQNCTVPANPQFMYVDNSTGTVQPYFDIATNYGFANRMFQTNQGPSFPAHQFIFGGTSAPSPESALFAADNLSVNGASAGCIAPLGVTVQLIDGYGSESSHQPIYPCFEHPTLTDLLEAASPAISWRYYAPSPGYIWTAPDAIRHICRPDKTHTTCRGADWKNGNIIANNPPKVLTDIANCNLPAVTWVIPFLNASDHAGGNKGEGPQWVASIVNAIGGQATCPNGDTYWNDTAIIITWDDWGGWYDHVPPFALNVQPNSPKMWGDGYTYGFRVPMMVVSAYTQAGYVSNNIYDFGSILYFIEQNFGLGFIGPGATIFGNYADYQAQTRGPLSDFFSLPSPQPFVPIPTRMHARDFINAPDINVGPDND